MDYAKHNQLPLSRAARKLAREIEIAKSFPPCPAQNSDPDTPAASVSMKLDGKTKTGRERPTYEHP